MCILSKLAHLHLHHHHQKNSQPNHTNNERKEDIHRTNPFQFLNLSQIFIDFSLPPSLAAAAKQTVCHPCIHRIVYKRKKSKVLKSQRRRKRVQVCVEKGTIVKGAKQKVNWPNPIINQFQTDTSPRFSVFAF
jgi:hypothetical protein